jgi:hypothetical protein
VLAVPGYMQVKPTDYRCLKELNHGGFCSIWKGELLSPYLITQMKKISDLNFIKIFVKVEKELHRVSVQFQVFLSYL